MSSTVCHGETTGAPGLHRWDVVHAVRQYMALLVAIKLV